MPDEIMLSGGTPFWPVGTDVAEDGEAFVTVYDEGYGTRRDRSK
jgi:hypothetical protein